MSLPLWCAGPPNNTAELFFVAERFRIFDHVHLSLGLWHTKFQFGGLFLGQIDAF